MIRLYKTHSFAIRVIVSLSIFVAVVACANFNKRSYQALGTMSVAYDTAMKSAADLHARGFISDAGKQEIVDYAKSFQVAHNQAIDAFQAYLAAPPEQQADKKQQFITASSAALAAYSEMLNLLTKKGVYGEPVEPWF